MKLMVGVHERKVVQSEDVAAVLRFPDECPLTDDLLMQIAAVNDGWLFERTAEGALRIMSAIGGIGGQLESELTAQLLIWWNQHQRGAVFSPSTGFKLSEQLVRSADGSWLSGDRLDLLTRSERERLIPACPDFLFEVRSPSQTLSSQQRKMEEWLLHGLRLGWLVDPVSRTVHIYRPGRETELVERPAALSAEPELDGFRADFVSVWRHLERGAHDDAGARMAGAASAAERR